MREDEINAPYLVQTLFYNKPAEYYPFDKLEEARDHVKWCEDHANNYIRSAIFSNEEVHNDMSTTKLLERYKEELEDCKRGAYHKSQYGDGFKYRYPLLIKLTQLGVPYREHPHGIMLDDRIVIQLRGKKWRNDGKAKWYYYSTLESLCDTVNIPYRKAAEE